MPDFPRVRIEQPRPFRHRDRRDGLEGELLGVWSDGLMIGQEAYAAVLPDGNERRNYVLCPAGWVVHV